jgi:hypothetical protein
MSAANLFVDILPVVAKPTKLFAYFPRPANSGRLGLPRSKARVLHHFRAGRKSVGLVLRLYDTGSPNQVVKKQQKANQGTAYAKIA